MLKLTPAFHHPSSIIIKKPQTHYTNFPKIHITSNKPFHVNTFPKICITNNKPFCISSCLKDTGANSVFKDVPKNSTLTSEKLQLHVSSVFDPIFSAIKWMFSLRIKWISPERSTFVVENDLITFEHNGKEIIGVVQHVVHHLKMGLMETTLLCELGSENFMIDRRSIYNLTLPNRENENMWSICISVECMDDGVMKMVQEIKDILNAHAELKYNSYCNLVTVKSVNPGTKIDVVGFVRVSQLKTPHFHHYMEVRRKVLSEIDGIRIKHGGCKEASSALGD